MPSFNFLSDLGAPSSSVNRYKKIPVPVAFRCGNYPDKNFALSPEEARSAVSDFRAPVNLDIEHKPSVLDGKLGALTRLDLQSNGDISGEVIIPEWLHPHLPKPTKVSVSFDRAAKKINGCALVLNPRVKDAAFFSAACAAFGMDEVENGPMPPPPPSIPPPPEKSPDKGAMHGAELAKGVKEMLQRAMDDAQAAGVFDPKYLKMLEKMIAMADAMGAGKEEPAEKTDENAEMSALRSDNAKLRADNAKLSGEVAVNQATQIGVDAVNFAENEIRQERAMPNERKVMVDLYVLAAQQDAVHFSSGKQGTAVATIKAAYAARPKHGLTREQLAVVPDSNTLDVGTATFSLPEGEKPKMTEARRKALLSMTETGKTVVNGKK